MRCLITGATGFLGSAVLRKLQAHQIPTALLIRETSDRQRIADCLADSMIFHGSFCDQGQVDIALSRFKPDTLIHMAWGGVSATERESLTQIESQFSTINLVLEAAKHGVKNIVAIGSQAEYGPKDDCIEEDSQCEPKSLYGIAKLSTSMLCSHLCKRLQVRFVWLRVFSCYGPGDHPSSMIATLIETLRNGRSPSLTQGTQKWDYLYVDDAADAITHAAKCNSMEGIYNLASGKSQELRKVIEMVRDQIDPELSLGFGEITPATNKLYNLQANVDRLKATGWEPKTQLSDGILATIDWHRKQLPR